MSETPDFSRVPTHVPTGNVVSDARGEIHNILQTDLPIGSAVLITSKKGSRRADHFHLKTGWHYCYIVSGVIEYLERPVGNIQPPERRTFIAGQMFFTPPQVEHAMIFHADTEFWCFSGNERSHEAYEADLVRLKEPLH